MKKILLSLGVIVSTYCSAQETPEKTTYKNDIGFNASIVLQGIFTASTTPFALMYKRYTRENKALRLGVTTNFTHNSVNSTPASGNQTVNTQTNGNVTLTTGLEWQTPLSQHWTWYYGGDLLPGYTYTLTETQLVNTVLQSNASNILSLSGRPFVGVRFNIGQRLYVSTEFSALLTYRFTETVAENPLLGEKIETEGNAWLVTLAPASAIFFFYRF